MDRPIVDPPVPYVGAINGGLSPGKMVRIQGIAAPAGNRFDINLQVGPQPQNILALHLSVRLTEGYIARNSCEDGDWGEEQGTGTNPIAAGQRFEVIILVDHSQYKIAVNGQHFAEFRHRIAYNRVTHLSIEGDVTLTLVSWEGSSAPPPQPGIAVPLSHGGSPGDLPPSYNSATGAKAPIGYTPVPQQPVPPVPGAGMQGSRGYQPSGPVPTRREEEEEKGGLDGFLESAQGFLEGAMKSGAADVLIGSITSSLFHGNDTVPGGHQPQNAQYGAYPHLDNPYGNGPYGNDPYGGPRRQPQQQQEGLGGFLSSLAGDLLNPNPRLGSPPSPGAASSSESASPGGCIYPSLPRRPGPASDEPSPEKAPSDPGNPYGFDFIPGHYPHPELTARERRKLMKRNLKEKKRELKESYKHEKAAVRDALKQERKERRRTKKEMRRNQKHGSCSSSSSSDDSD